MTEHEAMPAPPTTRIYVPADSLGVRDLDRATTHPPAGPLDGWTAVEVDAEAWEAFDDARHDYERAARTLKEADTQRVAATEALAREVDRG